MTTSPQPLQQPASEFSDALFQPDIKQRYSQDSMFRTATWIATSIGIVVLALLLLDVLADGLPRLNLQFLTSASSRKAGNAGVAAAIVGTLWLLGIVAFVAFPIGVGAGIFLEEFAKKSKFAGFIEINIANLAGVPSIIYGLLGLGIFVRVMEPLTGGRTVLSGGLTLALLVLPIIIVSTREALRTVPDSIRLAGFAVGATRWQTIREHVLPLALPGILTGTILSLSRAIGETAPLVVIGAAIVVAIPDSLRSRFTALPIVIFDWVSRPQKAFHTNAAAGIITLMVILLSMNTIAILLRNKFQSSKL
ncbi:MAG: phosphate ABC transporter permease PstA [Cyanobacteria bacterium]|nr:phosphate ABC transporter permease PstA [Cyanobacteriota bacterium]